MAPWNAPDPDSVRPAWVPPEGAPAYRGITVFGDRDDFAPRHDASVIRDRTFEGSVELDADYTINFFPWGAADTSTLTLDTGAETRVVQVLPTGIAEVQ